MAQYTDWELVEGIRNRDNDVLKYICTEYYPSIQYLINSNNGSDDEAKDVFQDIIVILFNKIKNKDFSLNCSFKTFIYAIGKNLWLKQLALKQRWNFAQLKKDKYLVDGAFDNVEIINYDDLKRHLYQKHFLGLNETCQKILQMVFNHVTFSAIADQLKLGNEQYARKRKYRCLQTLIKNIQGDPVYKALIKK